MNLCWSLKVGVPAQSVYFFDLDVRYSCRIIHLLILIAVACLGCAISWGQSQQALLIKRELFAGLAAGSAALRFSGARLLERELVLLFALF